MILYNDSDDDNLFTDNFWVPTVHVDLTEGLKVKSYIDQARRPRRADQDGERHPPSTTHRR